MERVKNILKHDGVVDDFGNLNLELLEEKLKEEINNEGRLIVNAVTYGKIVDAYNLSFDKFEFCVKINTYTVEVTVN